MQEAASRSHLSGQKRTYYRLRGGAGKEKKKGGGGGPALNKIYLKQRIRTSNLKRGGMMMSGKSQKKH